MRKTFSYDNNLNELDLEMKTTYQEIFSVCCNSILGCLYLSFSCYFCYKRPLN